MNAYDQAMMPGRRASRPRMPKKSQPLRDGYRDFIVVIASLGETRPRDIAQSECHWVLAAGFGAIDLTCSVIAKCQTIRASE